MHNTEDRHSTYSTYRACHASHIARSPPPFALPSTSYGLAPPGAHREGSNAEPQERKRPDPAGAPVSHQYLASIPPWYLTSISLWHRAIISSLLIFTVISHVCQSPLFCASLARPSGHDGLVPKKGGTERERSGGRGGQDLASQSSGKPLETMLERAGAEPTPRGGGGEGVALRYYCCDFLKHLTIIISPLFHHYLTIPPFNL